MFVALRNPQTLFIRITPNQRRRIEGIISDLVDLLDFVDGDEDLEGGANDEPCLGWPESSHGRGAVMVEGANDDREKDDELDEFNGDCEPSLGWTDHRDQSAAQRVGSLNYVYDGEADSNTR